MGIPARPKPARDAKVVKLYLDGGKTLEQIGRRHNITKQRVYQIVTKYRLSGAEVKPLDNNKKEEYTGDMKVSDASE
jgi:transposase-like protein